MTKDAFDVSRLRQLSKLMSASDYSSVIEVARAAWDGLGEDELRSKLETFDEQELFSISVDSWLAVAWGVSVADSFFNLAVAVWDEIPEGQQTAIGLLRKARELGSLDALPALAGYLLYADERDESLKLLKTIVADRSHGWERAAGLLGQEYLESENRHDDEVVELLQVGVGVSEDFLVPFANAKSARGDIHAARKILEEQSRKGEPEAPIRLGLLLEYSFDDPAGAEAAYLRGIELGDAYSAYNLATLLETQDRDDEARRWLEYAAEHGDSWAVDRLEEQY